MFPTSPDTSATTQLTIDDGVATQTTVASQPANTTIDPEQYRPRLDRRWATSPPTARPRSPYETLSANAVAGATVLTFATPVTGWQVGDSLELPDTRQLFQGYIHRHAVLIREESRDHRQHLRQRSEPSL